MKKVKTLKRWGIYALTEKEQAEYGFKYAVIHPEVMGCPHPYLNPSDTDMEMDSLEDAISWVENY